MTAELAGKRDGTGMSKREYTVSAVKEEGKRLLGLATAISKDKLNKGTIPELLGEIEALRDHVTEDSPDMLKLAKKKKPEIIDTLIKVRKQAFAANHELSAQFVEAAKLKAYGGKSMFENRGTELDRKFWQTEVEGHLNLTSYRIELE